MKTKSSLRGYALDIAKATSCRDEEILSEVEDMMRNVIFHSTLSWQSARQFNKGAREGYGLVLLIRRSATSTAQPEDAIIGRMLKINSEDVPALRIEYVQGQSG